MKLTPLRYLLLWDALLLFLLGAALILMPREVQRVFQFKDLSPAISYILGLWGCVLATLAVGYFVAARDPVKHILWVQIGIARGVLECIAGIVYLARGITSFQQSGLGIILAGLIALAYIAFYPRQRDGAALAV
nr:protein of unknown function (DUF3188) [uncultured bacterium]